MPQEALISKFQWVSLNHERNKDAKAYGKSETLKTGALVTRAEQAARSGYGHTVGRRLYHTAW